MSKIGRETPSVPPESQETPELQKSKDGISNPIEEFSKSILEPFQEIANMYDEILGKSAEAGPAFPSKELKGADFQVMQDRMLKARLGAPEGDSRQVQAQSSDSGKAEGGPVHKRSRSAGSKVAGDKKEVSDGVRVSKGDFKDKTRITDKELSNISGVINFRKGYTLWDGETHLARPLEIDESKTGDFGAVSAKGRVDVLGVHGRLFGQFDASWKEFVATIGLGVQGSFELIGGHVELKHDAPEVKLAGHDASLHSIINLDAFIGAFAEAGAILSIGSDTFLRIGAEAFAGASASISGATSLGDLLGVNATASAWAGVGAKAILDVGFEDGKIDVDVGVGAAVLYGAAIDWGFTVNVGELAKLAEDEGKLLLEDPLAFPGDFLQDVGHVLGTNVGSMFQLLDEVFSLTRKSEPLPGQQPQPDITERIREKQSQKPAEPLT